MAKIKLTKNELKRQKDNLKRFRHYLPMLMLKKQHLQIEIARIDRAIEDLQEKIRTERESVYRWVAVFAEDVGLQTLIALKKIDITEANIAGIDIPVFKRAVFDEKDYDFVKMPLWVDYALEEIKRLTSLVAQERVLNRQRKLIAEELRITTQRVNLFEKVKIPEAIENIRVIRIFLGDLQTASVVTGKFAKQKIEKKVQEAA